MLKKGSIMTRKNPIGTKVLFIGYYSFIYYIILQHFVFVIKLLFIISHFNHADFWRRKTEMAHYIYIFYILNFVIIHMHS